MNFLACCTNMKLLLILKRNIPTIADSVLCFKFSPSHKCVQVVGASLPCVSLILQVEEMMELLCTCRTMEVGSVFLNTSAP
jgi:hypothetical protein